MTNDAVVEVPQTAPVASEVKSKPQATAPKVLLKYTDRAKKLKKAPPTFTVGELLPWKGIWFEIVNIDIDRSLLMLRPKTEEVVEPKIVGKGDYLLTKEDLTHGRSSRHPEEQGDSSSLRELQTSKEEGRTDSNS